MREVLNLCLREQKTLEEFPSHFLHALLTWQAWFYHWIVWVTSRRAAMSLRLTQLCLLSFRCLDSLLLYRCCCTWQLTVPLFWSWFSLRIYEALRSFINILFAIVFLQNKNVCFYTSSAAHIISSSSQLISPLHALWKCLWVTLCVSVFGDGFKILESN